MVVVNKCDLPPAWNVETLRRKASNIHPVSADTGAGLDLLVRTIESQLVPHPPDAGAAVPFRPEQREEIEKARACLVESDLDGFIRRLEAIGGRAADSAPAPDIPG